MTKKNLAAKITQFSDKFQADEVLTRSAALAFYSSFAIAPLILLILSSLGFINLDMKNQLITEVGAVIGPNAAEVLQTIITQTKERPDLASLSGWFGIGLLLFSASIVFSELQSSLNQIFGVTESPKKDQSFKAAALDFVRRRLLSIGMVLSFIFITMVSLVLSATLSYMIKTDVVQITEVINNIFSFLIFGAIFAAMFKLLPERKLAAKNYLTGAAITAGLFVVGKYLISIYLAQSSNASVYGPAASLVLLLTWVYYSALIVFIGAELSYCTIIEPETKKPPNGGRDFSEK